MSRSLVIAAWLALVAASCSGQSSERGRDRATAGSPSVTGGSGGSDTGGTPTGGAGTGGSAGTSGTAAGGTDSGGGGQGGTTSTAGDTSGGAMTGGRGGSAGSFGGALTGGMGALSGGMSGRGGGGSAGSTAGSATAGSTGASGAGGATTDPSCLLPIDAGPCDGAIRRYAYDSNTGACRAFAYGGCEGNQNNFPTEAACRARCVD